jgi:hypothetical protein
VKALYYFLVRRLCRTERAWVSSEDLLWFTDPDGFVKGKQRPWYGLELDVSGQAATLVGIDWARSELMDDRPGSKSEKRYRSILAIPIVGEHNGMLGAVSVDSTRPHDFDLDSEDLVRSLMPYVSLLGWTLMDNGARGVATTTGVRRAEGSIR